jgi:PIN domain nuclease of toxin-antitoxin system
MILWTSFHTQRLSLAVTKILRDRANSLSFSVASIWEIAIKRRLKKPELQVDPDVLRNTMLRQGLDEITVLASHALAVEPLPPTHKDPFDRILIAQAFVEGITLLTSDKTIASYPGPTKRV